MGSQYQYRIITALKLIQWNSNIPVQFEFELEIYKLFDKTPIIFCDRFLTTVKMAHVKIYKIKSFLSTRSYLFQPKMQDPDMYYFT